MNKHTFLIDAMNLIYRCAYIPAFQNLQTSLGTRTGLVHGFMTSLLKFTQNKGTTIVAWDDFSKRKREVYPKYKHRREDKSDAIKQAIKKDIEEQTKIIRRILHLLGVDQYKCAGYEADEIIGTLTFGEGTFTIVSEDKDFLQLVGDKVNIWQPIKERMINTRNFKSFYLDLTPEEYFKYRLMTGDESDDIEGVPSCGEKTAIEIIQDGGVPKGKLAQKLLKKINSVEMAKIIDRNRRIMELTKHSVDQKDLNKGLHIGHDNGTNRLTTLLELYELHKVANLI